MSETALYISIDALLQSLRPINLAFYQNPSLPFSAKLAKKRSQDLYPGTQPSAKRGRRECGQTFDR